MLGRLAARLRAYARLHTEVGIWFHPGYGGPWSTQPAPIGHIEPRRGDLVVSRLLAERLIRQRDVRQPELVDPADLARFHSWRYVEEAGNVANLARILGLDPDIIDSDGVTSAFRRAVQGTLEASRSVAKGELRIGINLGGGFHHAEPELGSGFCVFNDVGVAIRALRAAGYEDAIAIIDLDVHQGNGNSVAFERKDDVRIYSVHGSVWSHGQDRVHREIHLRSAVSDEKYLAVLRTTLGPWFEDVRPRLVFFIAGADVLAGDRLGSFQLSLRGVFERDRYVTALARDVGAGLVVTMGGGYSPNAWLTHYNYVRFLLTGAVDIQTETAERAEVFDRASRELDDLELQQNPSDLGLDVTPEELYGDLVRDKRRAMRLLDFYSEQGVETALRRYGIFAKLEERGYEDPQVTLDLRDVDRQRVMLEAEKNDRRHRVLEFVVRRGPLSIPDSDDPPIDCLWAEWLLLQDPEDEFTLARPRLPGQTYPGLGLARDVVQLLIKVCERLGLGGMVDRPAHYHNAVGASPEFHFLDPQVEGRLRALETVLAGTSVAEASWLVENGDVRTAEGDVLKWLPEPHVLPLNDRLRAYFRSEAYRAGVLRATHDVLATHPSIQPGAVGAAPATNSSSAPVVSQ